MRRITAILLCVFTATFTACAAVTATKIYVDRQDAATLAAAQDYASNVAANVRFDTSILDNYLPTSWATNENVSLGFGNTWTPGNVIALGHWNVVTGLNAVAVGSHSEAKGDYSLAIGMAGAITNYASAIGFGTWAVGLNSFAGGTEARAAGEQSVAIGYRAVSSNNFGVAFGPLATAKGTQASAFGPSANAYGGGSVAVGYGANATASNSVAIGTRAFSRDVNAIVIDASTNDASASVHYSHGDGTITLAVDGSDAKKIYIGDRSLYSMLTREIVYRADELGTTNWWIDATGCVWRIASETTAWTQTMGEASYSVTWYDTDEIIDIYFAGAGWYVWNGDHYPTFASPDINEDVIECVPDSVSGEDYEDVRFERNVAGKTVLYVGRIALTNDVVETVRDLSLGGIWDEELQVWWTPRMRGGSLTYEATTNVNLNAGN